MDIKTETEEQFEIGLGKPIKDFSKDEKDIMKIVEATRS